LQEVPKEKIPPDAQKADTILLIKDPQGQTMAIRVHEVKDKTIIDFNHPLAGKTLHFDVKVTNIQVRRGKITSGSLYPSKIKKPGLGVPAGPQ
jgi:FKBP-type peptidyl-prolyl cis-trans isomerase 2